NLVFANGDTGITIGAGDKPGRVVNDYSVVSNNIAIDNRTFGIDEYGATGPHNQYLNNCTYGNGYGNFRLRNGLVARGTVTGARAHVVFVNYQANGFGDYHLASGSPCIDRGTSIGAQGTDLDGVARPQGAGFDIGPYEWVPRR